MRVLGFYGFSTFIILTPGDNVIKLRIFVLWTCSLFSRKTRFSVLIKYRNTKNIRKTEMQNFRTLAHETVTAVNTAEFTRVGKNEVHEIFRS